MNKLNLKVEIDNKSGFCFGVVGAISKAENTLDTEGELYCLGEIVHNDEEVKRLENKGLKYISKDQLSLLKNKNVLFRAHGEPPSSYQTAENNNNTIIDASCAIILKLQKKIRESYNQNENIYIYAKRNHPEVIGLNGQIDNKGVIFENINELDLESIPENITLYSQTTMSLEKFHNIIDALKNAGKNVKVKDTICRQVSNREPHLIEFSKSFDKIVFVSGKNSSNGKVLYNVCKANNPESYFISSADELKEEWFVENDKVGICGATSTPMWLMKQVEDILKSY